MFLERTIVFSHLFIIIFFYKSGLNSDQDISKQHSLDSVGFLVPQTMKPLRSKITSSETESQKRHQTQTKDPCENFQKSV